ncbi:MAG TPA: thioesterase family protein [Steroidobacter sp.]|uniref:acyl-CoA thioesterase n=1 Tax=Steroidobacter sp. TaxID=1978227 RepID=UPI002EDB4782
MQFSEILDSMGATGDECHVTVSDDWLQGRATFGGLVAAVGNEAMRMLVPRDRPLRSLQTTFVGPATPGTWRIRARVLRVGRAVTLAQCEVLDGDQVAAVQVGVYGMDRESAVLVKPAVIDPPRKVDEINEVRFDPERLPPFVQHFALRWAQGAKPFSGTRSPSKVFIRHRDPSPLTESHIVALVDCIPTPALSMYKAPAPGSSLVWVLEFFEHDLEFGAAAWWRIDSDIDAATAGYVNQTGLLHDPNGRPVALSRQLFAVFG